MIVNCERKHIGRRKWIGLLFILFTAAYSISFSQQSGWESYTCLATVRAIVTQGEMVWAGGNRGLACYNRNSGGMKFFHQQNSSIPIDDISALLLDHANRLWIGTTSGPILRFDGDDHWTEFDSGWIYPSFLGITSLAESPKGIIYAGTRGNGVYVFNGEYWDYGVVEIPSSEVQCLAIDSSYQLWISTSEGLFVYNDTTTAYIDGIAKTGVNAMACDSNGGMWMAMRDSVLNYAGGRWNTFYPKCSAGCNYTQIGFDHSGNVWLGSDSSVFKIHDSSIASYRHTDYHLPGAGVSALAISKDNNVWIGTDGGFAGYADGVWTTHATQSTELPSNKINTIGVDGKGTAWIGTDYGLTSFDGDQWHTYNASNSMLPNDTVSKIVVDGAGTKWIRVPGALVKVDSVWRIYRSSDLDKHFEITIDYNNNLWIGLSNSNMLSYDGHTWDTIENTNGNPDFVYMNAMAADRGDGVWLGTQLGILHYTGTAWDILDESALPTIIVSALAIDSFNVPWMGTSAIIYVDLLGIPHIQTRGGVAVYDHGVWESERCGGHDLVGNGITSIAVDRQNTIWILSDQALNRRGDLGFTHFDYQNSPLPYPEDFQSTLATLAVDGFDRVWIGTTNGLFVYHDVVNGIGESSTPSLFHLEQNFPNPFNPSTTIRYSIAERSFVTLDIFDVLGEKVTTLVSKEMTPGEYTTKWNAGKFSSGVYFCRLRAENFCDTKKLVLVR